MSELPAGWSSVQLGDLTKVLTKGTTPTTLGFSYQPLGVRFVKAESLAHLRIVPELCAYIGNDAHAALSRSELHPDDVLFSIAGTLGRVGVVTKADCPANTNQALAIIRPADGRLTPFLSRFLSGPFRAALVEEGARGTGLQNLNLAQLSAAQVDVPPLAEQRRIVAKLDVLTARTARARADLDRIPALAARYKQAVLAKAFTGELTAGWRKANAIDLATWRLTPVGSLTRDVRYGTATKCNFSPSETPVLRIPNIAKGRIDTSDLKHATFDDKERGKLALEVGDVLVIRSNGSVSLVGRAAVVTAEAVGFLYAGYLIRLRLDQEQVNADYLQRAFEEPSIRAAIESSAKSTSGVNNINSEQLKGLSLPLPILAEQVEIVRRIEHAFTEIDRLTAEATAALRLLDRLDQAVLAKAFRGELVAQDPADEPASVLLDRIRAERAAAPRVTRGRRKAVS